MLVCLLAEKARPAVKNYNSLGCNPYMGQPSRPLVRRPWQPTQNPDLSQPFTITCWPYNLGNKIGAGVRVGDRDCTGTVLTQEPELKLPHSEQQMRQPVGTNGVAAAEAIDWGV